MNITEVKIHKLTDSNTLAFASITINKEFVVTGLKVLQGKNGIWVAMPNRKDGKGEYHDIAFPITKETRDYIQAIVLQEYEKGTYSDYVKEKKESPRLDDISEDSPF